MEEGKAACIHLGKWVGTVYVWVVVKLDVKNVGIATETPVHCHHGCTGAGTEMCCR
jgi:hypothetical protein